MISNGCKKYCIDDISLVENYSKAINDTENIWYCHHKQGVYMSREELEELGWYYNCPADCLIFVTLEEHNSLHHTGKKESIETRNKKSKSHYKVPKSEFGRKFLEHYNVSKTENVKLYDTERGFYRRHGKCSWEV